MKRRIITSAALVAMPLMCLAQPASQVDAIGQRIIIAPEPVQTPSGPMLQFTVSGAWNEPVVIIETRDDAAMTEITPANSNAGSRYTGRIPWPGSGTTDIIINGNSMGWGHE